MGTFWKDKRIFITGATGLLGGWLVKALLNEDAELIALVRDRDSRSMPLLEGVLHQVAVVTGDLDSPPTLQRVISEYEPHTVFHLASQPLVSIARRDPVKTLRTNVMGTWNVLEACRLHGNINVIVASSDKAYGPSESLPYRETHPLQGRYPYDVSKSCTDLIAQMYAATYGLRTAIVRCANIFGGGDLNFSRTIPGIIKAALDGEAFVIRSDGKFVRDFLYVKDAVEAYLLLARRLAETPGIIAGEAFNFSLGERRTVLDTVHMTLRVMGRTDLEPVIQNIASAEIREQYLDSGKAREILGWQPRYGMEEGIRETVSWYREYFNDQLQARHSSNAEVRQP